jgi:hypothetical protein
MTDTTTAPASVLEQLAAAEQRIALLTAQRDALLALADYAANGNIGTPVPSVDVYSAARNAIRAIGDEQRGVSLTPFV